MSKLTSLACVLVCLAAIGCGVADDPDARTDDWEESWTRSTHATDAGDHQQAISVAEAFLKKHPDSVDGQLMVADALAGAARAASDFRRPEQFKEAATHYTRALELTKNPNWRFLATMGLVQVNGPKELNDPVQATRYARALVDNDPKNISSYQTLLEMLKTEKKYDEAAALVREAKDRVEPSADSYAAYGTMVHDLVSLSSSFPPDTGRALLTETAAVLDQSLGRYGRTKKLLLSKGMILRAQAEIEPDRQRQRAFEDESRRTFEEMDALSR